MAFRYVWLGRSMVGYWIMLSARKTHKCDANFCKSTSPYFSTGRIPVMINYCYVVAGLKWMASSMVLFRLIVFVTAFFFAYSSLLGSTWTIHNTRKKKLRNCTDSLLFIHSFFRHTASVNTAFIFVAQNLPIFFFRVHIWSWRSYFYSFKFTFIDLMSARTINFIHVSVVLGEDIRLFFFQSTILWKFHHDIYCKRFFLLQNGFDSTTTFSLTDDFVLR